METNIMATNETEAKIEKIVTEEHLITKINEISKEKQNETNELNEKLVKLKAEYEKEIKKVKKLEEDNENIKKTIEELVHSQSKTIEEITNSRDSIIENMTNLLHEKENEVEELTKARDKFKKMHEKSAMSAEQSNQNENMLMKENEELNDLLTTKVQTINSLNIKVKDNLAQIEELKSDLANIVSTKNSECEHLSSAIEKKVDGYEQMERKYKKELSDQLATSNKKYDELKLAYELKDDLLSKAKLCLQAQAHILTKKK